MSNNRQIVLQSRPHFFMPTADCFRLQQGDKPAPESGKVLVRTLWLAMDPYLHARIKRVSRQAEPIPLHSVMLSPTVGRVEDSDDPELAVGDLVYGFWGWQDYALADRKRVKRIDKRVKRPSYALGALTLPGFAAWIALNDLAPAKAGETVVVGTAVGALGQNAGQIAKIKGCRTVGIVGHADKCELATDKLGYDACVDRTAEDFPEQLRQACPDGIDVYVETIGGAVTAAVLPLLNHHARLAVCGLMSFITATREPKHALPADVLLNEVINRRLSIRGLVSFDHIKTRMPAFEEEMIGWLESGQITPLEDVVEGLENAPQALQELFQGKNRGRLLVHVAD